MVDHLVTTIETERRRTPRLRALVLGAGLLVAACSGSDAATSGSTPDSAIESEGDSGDDGDVFSEGDTTTDGTAASDAVDEADTDPADVDEADSEDTSTADPDEASTSEPTATGDVPVADQDDVADPEPEASNEPDEVVPEPDEFDELDDLITVDAVDDVPFCQSYARIFEAFLGITFAGVFGGLTSDDPEAQVALAETYEVIVYPGLTDDVETIRNEGIDELEQVFGPLFERIDAAPGLLRDAGLSDDEITELTAGVRPADLESIDLDGLDPRVTEAAVALQSEFGSFLDATNELSTPPADEEAFEERLDSLCPLLAESFNES